MTANAIGCVGGLKVNRRFLSPLSCADTVSSHRISSGAHVESSESAVRLSSIASTGGQGGTWRESSTGRHTIGTNGSQDSRQDAS
jgi:hypothetical protein